MKRVNMDEAREIRERITGFAINQIPPKTKEEFIRFAREEYCDNRGMALNFLWQFYTGVISSGVEHLEQEILMLKEEVAKLQKQPVEEKKKQMMDGRIR